MMRKKLSVTTIKHSTLIKSHHFSLTKGGALISMGTSFMEGANKPRRNFLVLLELGIQFQGSSYTFKVAPLI